MSKFLQFHTLTSYPGTLLNRDDAGFAKTLPFGNAKRTRVSSQCLKYHWRHYDGKHAIRKAGDMSIRSRRTFRKKIADELVDEGFDERLTAAVTFGILEMARNGDVTKGAIKDNVQPVLEADDPLDELTIKNIVVFGKPEIDYLKSVAEDTLIALKDENYDDDSVAQTRDAIADLLSDKELSNNLRGMSNAMGIDAAMHGRMVTSDVLAQGDAAVHVAHAITTHAQQREDDYFTAVDELHDEGTGGEEAGAALIQSKELTSGLFYNYVVVDVPLLVSNLEGCARNEWRDADLTLTTDVLQRFLHTITNVSPGAKLSSTAPYAKAEFVMVESGEEQPRTLANSFKHAVEGDDLLEASVRRLTQYTRDIDEMYGKTVDGEIVPHEDRVCATMAKSEAPAPRSTVSDIADNWIPSQLTTHASA
ncbi:type I-E CRISPR-associated protein Cas7/Cse4/CasC [Salinibacter sp.]|uniref:type I-E CRISPR-associated protein Cas7/Cse4/CasC n=1 Tax=Salinibacter sp. TaxID=2065818 RepID=UPI0021E8AF82|nr:type I-E CRISPR-associated protein Cas7/Cse4/CasC [Salinibacter sp.]